MTCRLLFVWAFAWACEAATFDETFPLSGGFTAGMKVRFVASLTEGMAHIDFLTPERQVGYRWTIDTVEQNISRSVPDLAGMDAQQWGGYPFGAESGTLAEIEFVRTQYAWAATVLGKRTPWFDFKAGDHLITHAKVHGAWGESVTVVQTRPVCEVQCHPDECQCPDGDMCYSLQGGLCSSSNDTGAVADSFCCDGRPTFLDFDTVQVGDFAKVFADKQVVAEACSIFGLNKAGDACIEDALLSSKVQIESVDPVSRIATVFSVVRSGLEQPTSVTFPAYALSQSPVIKKFINITKAEMRVPDGGAADITVNFNTGLITQAKGQALADGVEQYWYINMMTTHKGTLEWYQFFQDRWEFAASDLPVEETIHLIVSDGISNTTTCTDRLNVTGGTEIDSDKNTCADYESKNYCTSQGRATDEYQTKYGAGSGLYATSVVVNINGDTVTQSAPWWCCVCGGGLLERPSNLINSAEPPMMIFK